MRLHNWQPPGISRRSRVAIGLIGATWRPLTFVIPPSRAGVRAMRALIAGALSVTSPPVRGTDFVRVDEQVGNGLVVRGSWVRAPGTSRADDAILYIHGSGYAICSSETHRGLTSHLSAATGLPVFSIDYRLSPTHRYPAAPQDVRGAWEWLIANGRDPARIVVAGDSAGGHLAITLALELARAGEPLPAAVVALSPILDLSMTAAIPRDRIERDPFAAAVVARKLLLTYADAEAQRDEGLRIDFRGVHAFPPVLIHAGSREMLGADCTELARRIRGAGFEVEHRVWPGQMHVFQAMTVVFPESHVAIADIARFVATHLPVAKSNLTAVASA